MSLIQMSQWLALVENQAFEFYQKAQSIPRLGSGFVDFLRECAEEEAWHLNAIKKAGRLLEAHGDTESDVEIDAETRERVERPLKRILEWPGPNPPREREVMKSIALAEFSEWNPIFVYFLGRISNLTGELLYPAARVQSHLQKIINYFELAGFEHEILRRLKTLPRVWEESILVVDDEPGIRELISGFLNTQGRVDLARDGQEALALLKNHYYKAVVTDLIMPNLDGMGLFRQARQIHPQIGGRFIFITGSAHLMDQGEPGLEQATVLQKPFRAWELIREVKARLGQS